MKQATTFGSSSITPEEKEYHEGIKLGEFLALKGYQVKCGGYGGLMEAVSIGVERAEGHCTGMCLDFFEKRRPENPHLSDKKVSEDIYGRLRNLIEESSLFIVQKGSLGTLNELFMVWTLAYIGIKKDIRICLIGKEWEPLKHFPMIDGYLFGELEFFDNADDFIQNGGL